MDGHVPGAGSRERGVATGLRWSDGGDRDLRAFLNDRGSLRVARGGELLDALAHPALIDEEHGSVVGALTYAVRGSSCEILTLHCARRWSGVGTSLVAEVARLAAEQGCNRYWVTTTNDNVDALRFYQRRGFRLSALRHGAIDQLRGTLKPEIPLIGDYGIPIRDEIELAQRLPMGLATQ